MEVRFIKSEHRRVPTIVRRRDGVELSVPLFGPLEPIPHDLAHFVVENELRLHGGFWGSVANGAVFGGMKVLAGRQRPHARERSEALMKANHREIMLSEGLVAAALRVHAGTTSLTDLPTLTYAGEVFPHDAQTAAIERLLLPIEEMCARWAATPLDGTLTLEWFDRRDRVASREQRRSS